MFKINNPKLNNLINIKYKEVKDKEQLEKYNISNENIKLWKSIEIRCCKFDGIIFDEVRTNFSNFEDVEFVNCDLSNISFIDSTFLRIKFENCKLFGTNFIDCDLSQIIIKNCMCNLINIAGTKIQNTKIIDSEFKNSRMMSNILKNTLIENINLAFSEFINTSLCNIDLSTCNIDKIKIDLNSIKGATISFEQSIYLIGLLEVKIK